MTDVTGSPLFQRTMDFKHDDARKQALMLKVWACTPWVVTADTGRCGEDRDCEIREWCRDQFGDEAWPIHGRQGDWQRGSATVHGQTWFGFATEAQMKAFVAKWGEVLP